MSERLAENTVVRPLPNVYARAFGAELVLLDFSRGEYYGLDEVGAVVWGRIEAGDAIGAIADYIVDRYEVTRDVAVNDVVLLVEQLVRDALVAVS